ncbi:MAG: tyrosine-type recombinase/integrase [Peptoniphilus senegalensis]
MYDVRIGKIYKDKRGYFRGDVVLDNGIKPIRKSFSAKKKYDLIEKRDEWIEKYKDLYLDPFSSNTLGQLYHNWIYTVKKGKTSDNTLYEYVITLNNRIKGYSIENVDVSEMNPFIVEDYIKELSKNNSNSTVKKTVAHLNSFYNYCLNNNLVKNNPFAGVTITADKKKREAYTLEEQKIILNNLDFTNSVDLIIYTSMISGLRKGETIALRIQDLKDNFLDIDKQYKRVTSIDEDDISSIYQVDTLKTEASYRRIPLPTQSVKILKANIARVHELRLKSGYEFNPNDLMFPSETGGYIEAKRPTRRLKRLCEETGIEYKTFHALRHTYITRLAENDIQPKIAQVLAGHSNYSTTMNVYTHISDQQKQKAIDIITNNNVFTL